MEKKFKLSTKNKTLISMDSVSKEKINLINLKFEKSLDALDLGEKTIAIWRAHVYTVERVE